MPSAFEYHYYCGTGWMTDNVRRRNRQRSEERYAQMLSVLARQGSASLADLQDVTGASIATTRRDLSELASRELIVRTHGGARLLASNSSLDEEFERRQERNARAKGAIASAAADLVHNGMSLFINDGSTALAFAHELSSRAMELWVATCALNIAELLARRGSIEVIVIGGSLRRTSFGTVGPLATSALAQLHADLAFIGCDAIHLDGPRSNSIYDAEVARTMSRNAQETIVIADATKLHKPARSVIVPWSDSNRWITDDLEMPTRTEFTTAGARVTTALS